MSACAVGDRVKGYAGGRWRSGVVDRCTETHTLVRFDHLWRSGGRVIERNE